jgi:DNA repair exonuclease SbcCD ATPase subunit
MKSTREEKRTALETKAKALIDELIKWSDETERPDLTQIEDEILKLRQRLSESMLEAVIERQESRRPVPGPQCPKCGKEMQYKGDKARQVTSRVGEVKLERGHYYCSPCKESVFPPGPATESGRKALERRG